jgi:hypothetical protein
MPDTLTVVPSHVGIGRTMLDDKELGVFRISGSTTEGRIALDVVLDLPTLSQVVAELDRLRAVLVEGV